MAKKAKVKVSRTPRVPRAINLTFSMLGILLSSYSLYVELRKESDPSYRPMCDLHEHVSCSKAFMSEYGKGFGVVAPILGQDSIFNQFNSLYGVLLFGLLSILGFLETEASLTCQKWLLVVFNLGSVYLWCILTFVLKNVCIVCYGIYVINAIMLITNLAWLKAIEEVSEAKRR